jgi:hypothetical protein
MTTIFLVLTLSYWIINGDLTLAILTLLIRTITVPCSILSIGAEEHQGLTALVSIGVLTIVGFMPRSALSERFGENSKSKELELPSLSRVGPQLHGGT